VIFFAHFLNLRTLCAKLPPLLRTLSHYQLFAPLLRTATIRSSGAGGGEKKVPTDAFHRTLSSFAHTLCVVLLISAKKPPKHHIIDTFCYELRKLRNMDNSNITCATNLTIHYFPVRCISISHHYHKILIARLFGDTGFLFQSPLMFVALFK